MIFCFCLQEDLHGAVRHAKYPPALPRLQVDCVHNKFTEYKSVHCIKWTVQNFYITESVQYGMIKTRKHTQTLLMLMCLYCT